MTVAIQSSMFSTLGQHAGVSALIGTRVYPDIAPQGVTRPFVVWEELSEQQMSNLTGSVQVGGLSNYLITVTSWATSATVARDLDQQVRLAMIAATLFKSVFSDSQSLGYDPETKLFAVQTDFSVWLNT